MDGVIYGGGNLPSIILAASEFRYVLRTKHSGESKGYKISSSPFREINVKGIAVFARQSAHEISRTRRIIFEPCETILDRSRWKKERVSISGDDGGKGREVSSVTVDPRLGVQMKRGPN